MPLKPKKIRRCKPSRRTATGFKPTKIPKGFVLLIDTREQKPLFTKSGPFTNGEKRVENGITMIGYAVKVGDYTIQGYEEKVCVERKELSDFLRFIGAERKAKTIPKLKRMNRMNYPYVAIEVSKSKLFPRSGRYKYSDLTVEHTRGFLKKITVWRIPYVYTSDRVELERYVLDHLCYAYEIMKGV